MRRLLWGLSAGACREAQATTETAAVQPLPRKVQDAGSATAESESRVAPSMRFIGFRRVCPLGAELSSGEVRNTYLFAWNL